MGFIGFFFCETDYSIRNIGIDYIMNKHLKLNMFLFYTEVFGKTFGYLLVVLLIGICIHYIPINGWGGFCLKGILVSVIYFIVVYFYAFNSYEQSLVTSFLRIKYRKS